MLAFVGKLLSSQADPGSHRRGGTRCRTAHSRSGEDRPPHTPWLGCTVPKGRKLIAHGVSRGLRPTIARGPGGAAEIFRPCGAGRIRRPVTPGLRPGLLTFAPSGLSPPGGCRVRVGVVQGSGKQPGGFRRSLSSRPLNRMGQVARLRPLRAGRLPFRGGRARVSRPLLSGTLYQDGAKSQRRGVSQWSAAASKIDRAGSGSPESASSSWVGCWGSGCLVSGSTAGSRAHPGAW